MSARLTVKPLTRTQFANLADWLAVALAASVPWSTSATGILAVLWLIALVPSFTWADIRREVTTAAGGLPVLLALLGILGMAWADVSWHARWEGLDGFAKLLAIPLLMAQFRRSDRGHWVFKGFLVACVVLLIASVAVTIWPDLPIAANSRGVVVKAYIVQSVEFAICAAVLFHIAVEQARSCRLVNAAALLVLSLVFLGDIFFISSSRTTLVVIAALFLGYGLWQFGWKGFVGAAAAGTVLAALLWTTSPYLRHRVSAVYSEFKDYQQKDMNTSTGERIVFWKKSIRFISSAPLLGHGTGSIPDLFRHAAVGKPTSATGTLSANPHNLTFAVGIQIGLLGIAVLWAMWIAQLLVFRGADLTTWIGLVLLIQNVVGSLFNSFLFDFTEGWLYVIGIGVAMGTVLRQTGGHKKINTGDSSPV